MEGLAGLVEGIKHEATQFLVAADDQWTRTRENDLEFELALGEANTDIVRFSPVNRNIMPTAEILVNDLFEVNVPSGAQTG